MNAEALELLVSEELEAAATAETGIFHYEREGSEHRLLRIDIERGIGLAMAVQPDSQRQAESKVWRVRVGRTDHGTATLIWGNVAGPQFYIQEYIRSLRGADPARW